MNELILSGKVPDKLCISVLTCAKIEEAVIIGIDNTADRIDEYTYSYDKTVPVSNP